MHPASDSTVGPTPQKGRFSYWPARTSAHTAADQFAAAFFGFGPKRFSPSWLSSTMNTNNTIVPISGISPIKIHQPLRPMSCKRRAVTEIEGTSIASAYKTLNTTPAAAPSN